jgi:hypothetical protein
MFFCKIIFSILKSSLFYYVLVKIAKLTKHILGQILSGNMSERKCSLTPFACQPIVGQPSVFHSNVWRPMPVGQWSFRQVPFQQCSINIYEQNVCQPNACQPNVCQQNVCQPNVCQQNA